MSTSERKGFVCICFSSASSSVVGILDSHDMSAVRLSPAPLSDNSATTPGTTAPLVDSNGQVGHLAVRSDTFLRVQQTYNRSGQVRSTSRPTLSTQTHPQPHTHLEKSSQSGESRRVHAHSSPCGPTPEIRNGADKLIYSFCSPHLFIFKKFLQ